MQIPSLWVQSCLVPTRWGWTLPWRMLVQWQMSWLSWTSCNVFQRNTLGPVQCLSQCPTDSLVYLWLARLYDSTTQSLAHLYRPGVWRESDVCQDVWSLSQHSHHLACQCQHGCPFHHYHNQSPCLNPHLQSHQVWPLVAEYQSGLCGLLVCAATLWIWDQVQK